MAVDRYVLRRMPPRFRDRIWQIAFRVRGGMFSDVPAGSLPQSEIAAETADVLPDWLEAEMVEIAREVDADLYPSALLKSRLSTYRFPANEAPGALYSEIAALAPERPTHCFVAPWLVRGGADLGALHFVRAVAAQPGTRVVVILTEPVKSPWTRELPDDVKTIHLGTMAKPLGEPAKLEVFTRLLIQMRPDVVHIVNSAMAWGALNLHGAAIAGTSRVFASLFCEDRDENGLEAGYAARFLTGCQRYLSGVLTDSAQFGDHLAGRHGMDREKIHTVYFPTLASARPPRQGAATGRVLWASRLARQKRPDLLARIASLAPDLTFLVYGEQMAELGVIDVNALNALRNVKLKGGFDGFASLPTEKVDLFLYTSEWDGLPNVLLEAVAAGLPVVASEVGGINELINEETGFLVRDADNPEAYVEAVREVLADRSRAGNRARAAQVLVANRHEIGAFNERLASLPGYLRPKPAEMVAAAE